MSTSHASDLEERVKRLDDRIALLQGRVHDLENCVLELQRGWVNLATEVCQLKQARSGDPMTVSDQVS